MVWASVAVALLALFPEALSRIKKLKLKDFELELQESIEKVANKPTLSVLGLEEHVFSMKGDLSRLEPIVEQALRFPSRAVLLVVNLRESHHVSIPMLFIYLFYLDLVGAPIMVLFVSTRSTLRNISDLTKSRVIGTIAGKRVLREFYEQFPSLSRIFVTQARNDNFSVTRLFQTRRSDGLVTELANAVYRDMQESGFGFREHLSTDEIQRWFGSELNVRSISSPPSISDTKTLLGAITSGDDYIHIFENTRLISVVSLCSLTKDLAQKALAERITTTTQ